MTSETTPPKDMASLKDKYWNDQIKSMLGPCMITFAIPITIPGVTITLVAFSGDKALPLYGALHVTGLVLLILAVMLIFVGCILKYVWKPFISLDIEMQLSPRSSVRRSRNSMSKNKLDGIYTDRNDRNSDKQRHSQAKESEPVPEAASFSVVPPINSNKHVTDYGGEASGSRSQDRKSTSGYSEPVQSHSNLQQNEMHTDSKLNRNSMLFDDNISSMPPINSRHLPPISPRPLTHGGVNEEHPTLDEIQTWRKKKKKRKSKRLSDPQKEADHGVVNQGSDCDEGEKKRCK